MNYEFRFDVVWNNMDFLLDGIWLTLVLSFLALGLSLVVGLVVAAIRLAPPRIPSFLGAVYVEVFRDTPVLVQLFWMYYVLPILLGVPISAFMAALIALTLHSSAYLSENFRAGIQAVPRGHIEAAKVLGLRPWNTFIRIILPQAWRTVLPPMVNNFVDLIKVSSLASVISVGEITRKATELSSATFRPMEIFTVVALMYFLICWPLSSIMRVFERRLEGQQ